jgi:regulator of cell morphogenesis and NO signaling
MPDRKGTVEMITPSIETPVGQLVAERLSRARVFERLGIDYCCGGKTPLGLVCTRKGLDPYTVLHELAINDAATAADDTDWSRASLTALADHIETAHHGYLRAELPRLAHLVRKVASVHGDQHPKLQELHQIFDSFRSELETHMLKEERVLFALCRALENASSLPPSHCGSINNPIRVMVLDHEDAGEALARMRQLTDNFTPPEDACISYRTMLDGLAELERDMHLHVHKENNILFPRASATEAALAA